MPEAKPGKITKEPTAQHLEKQARRQEREQEKLARKMVYGSLRRAIRDTAQEFKGFLENPFVLKDPPEPKMSKAHEGKLNNVAEKGGEKAVVNVTREVLSRIDKQGKTPLWGEVPKRETHLVGNDWEHQLLLNKLLDKQEQLLNEQKNGPQASRPPSFNLPKLGTLPDLPPTGEALLAAHAEGVANAEAAAEKLIKVTEEGRSQWEALTARFSRPSSDAAPRQDSEARPVSPLDPNASRPSSRPPSPLGTASPPLRPRQSADEWAEKQTREPPELTTASPSHLLPQGTAHNMSNSSRPSPRGSQSASPSQQKTYGPGHVPR
ncbi:hypothetical protein [Streptomyces sp. OE57]|uniref:hypothetical protein n=1 Tax=Streptomyces lacaronensis TaxID=3379885 RepID=UPI0039B79123